MCNEKYLTTIKEKRRNAVSKGNCMYMLREDKKY